MKSGWINSILSIGSNKGDSLRNIKESLYLLLDGEKCVKESISSIYRTDPVDEENQPEFFNIALSCFTCLSAEEFLAFIKSVETKIGKEKEGEKGARKIDIDIIFYGNDIIKKKNLIIPHKEAHKRLFVIKPLMEIKPFYVHPELNKSVRDIYFYLKTEKKVIFFDEWQL